MKKPRFSVALTMIFLFLIIHLPFRAQGQADEYTRQLNLAHSYAQEQRYQDALDAVRKAYDIRPSPELLAEMGSDFLALGMGTEAEDVLLQALKQGGEVRFDLLHRHSFGQCTGSLILSKGQVRWAGAGKKDTFQVSAGEIEGTKKWDSSVSENGTEQQFTLPMLRFHASKKGWNYELLLYGQTAKYHTFLHQLDTYVAYDEPDLTNTGKATELIARLLERLPSFAQTAEHTESPARVPDLVEAQSNTPKSGPSRVPSDTSAEHTPGGAQAEGSLELKEGQTPAEVEKVLGKPQDTITLKENLVYVYPTVKVFFENGKLTNVEEDHKPDSSRSSDSTPSTAGIRGEPHSALPQEINETRPFLLDKTFGSREAIDFSVARAGTIVVDASWDQSRTLALILNGPGQVQMGNGRMKRKLYARQDGRSPLRAEYRVSEEDVSEGSN